MEEPALEAVPLSALQHYAYCPRQCALIYVEQIFDENSFTLKGRWAHSRVDEERVVSSGDNQILTALPIWSDKHGLAGKCDVVEIRDGLPIPVEFKHGRREAHVWDEIQLCSQAICLEEMFQVEIPCGYIYHISSRRRREVQLNDELRQRTLSTGAAVRRMIAQGEMPPAANDQRCTQCSLYERCMPEATYHQSALHWNEVLQELEGWT